MALSTKRDREDDQKRGQRGEGFENLREHSHTFIEKEWVIWYERNGFRSNKSGFGRGIIQIGAMENKLINNYNS